MGPTREAGSANHAAQADDNTLDPGELHRRRRALRLTQAELADRLAVSANTVARWERGELRIGRPRQVARTLARLETNQLATPESRRPRKHKSAPAARTAAQSAQHQPRHHLPAELSSFVGREIELTRLTERLRTARLLTLVGTGGVGKTRLALQLANLLLPAYADGAHFVELAPVAESSMVANVVGASLGVPERGRIPIAQLLSEMLRDRELLLILDNCEHLLDGCASLVHALLRECRHLTILATSREPLRVVGEVQWRVPPLSIEPHAGGDPDSSEAVQLFIERARDAKVDFDQTNEAHKVVRKICAQLDGLPLAIELAAARTGSIPVRALLQQLESSSGRLPVLVNGPRDAPARQQTLGATIAWSYELLTPDERALFRRLAPFRGCSMEAVEAVCLGEVAAPRETSVSVPPLDLTAEHGLAALVTRNLLQVEEDGQGGPWYSMLETVREFALGRLESSPESAAVWRRHAWHYVRFVEQSAPQVRALRQDAFLDRLEREHANIRAAMDWCQSHGYAEASLRLAVGMFWFWTVRGYMTEGRARIEALLARFPLRARTGTRAHIHAQALDAVGHIAAAQGELETAVVLEREALALFEQLNDIDGVLAALDALTVIARKHNDLDRAGAYAQRTLETLRGLSPHGADTAMFGLALATLGTLAHEHGEERPAGAYLEEAARLIDAAGDAAGTGLVKLNLAVVAHERGDREDSEALAESALQMLEREHDRRGVALALAHLGNMATTRRDLERAYAYLARSLQLNMDLVDRHGVAFVLDRFAILAATSGQPERGVRLAGAAAALREQAGLLPNVFEQRYIDAQIAPARAALGRLAPGVFDDGRALSIEQAAGEALAVAQGAPAVKPPVGTLQLSSRERQVVALVGQGYTNRRIAAALVVSEATAATHVRNVLSKLQLDSRAQLAVWVSRHGLLNGTVLERGERDAPVS